MSGIDNEQARSSTAMAPLLGRPGSRIGLSHFNTFEHFNKLPVELRLRIWKITAFFQRNVNIMAITLPNFYPEVHHGFVSHCPPPAMLAVCRESRHEGMKYYRLDFDTSKQRYVEIGGKRCSVTVSTSPIIYINWEADRVVVPSPATFEDYVGARVTERAQELGEHFRCRGLRYLAFNMAGDDMDDEITALDFLPYDGFLGSLEELIFFSIDRDIACRLDSFDLVDVADDEIYQWLPFQQSIHIEFANFYGDSYVLPRIRFCEVQNERLRPGPRV
ncbi:hypothetical protein EG329_003456 [Mollisiaceae sp. DMI_Dod_QoI]|nr:hypothetical protein EG329_003456 [Helotiales sp. DMI_Dod_QoI]